MHVGRDNLHDVALLHGDLVFGYCRVVAHNFGAIRNSSARRRLLGGVQAELTGQVGVEIIEGRELAIVLVAV